MWFFFFFFDFCPLTLLGSLSTKAYYKEEEEKCVFWEWATPQEKPERAVPRMFGSSSQVYRMCNTLLSLQVEGKRGR